MIDEHKIDRERVNIADRTTIVVAGIAIGVSLFGYKDGDRSINRKGTYNLFERINL